jgi:hypothetical protein
VTTLHSLLTDYLTRAAIIAGVGVLVLALALLGDLSAMRRREDEAADGRGR